MPNPASPGFNPSHTHLTGFFASDRPQLRRIRPFGITRFVLIFPTS